MEKKLKNAFTYIGIAGSTLAISLITILNLSRLLSAESVWINSSQPKLEKVATGLDNLTTQYAKGNRDCQSSYMFKKDPMGTAIQYNPSFYPTYAIQRCTLTTPLGLVGGDYLAFKNDIVAGRLQFTSGFVYGIEPIPNRSGVFMFSNSYVFYEADPVSKIQVKKNTDSTLTYTLDNSTAKRLNDKSGTAVQLDYNSIAFSSNGRWLVGVSPSKAVVRVDLDTLEVVPFVGLGGSNETRQLAISDDGEFAVVSDMNRHTLKLYDLTSCAAAPSAIGQVSGLVSGCLEKDVLAQLQAVNQAYGTVSTIRFINTQNISFYTNVANSNFVDQYILTAPGQITTKLAYLAMGDSFSSGEGDLQGSTYYLPGTDFYINEKYRNVCHNSTRSYPYVLSARLSLTPYSSVACSGAVAIDLEKAKYDAPSVNTYGKYLPGVVGQYEILSETIPEVVTMSLGGNDIGFADKLAKCLEANTCYYTYDERREIVSEIQGLFGKLTTQYDDMKAKAPGKKIIIVGYPITATPGGDCAVNVHLDADEVTFAKEITRYLNDVIKAATQYSGVAYADVEESLAGHRLCDSSPKKAVNGLTAGNDIFGIVGNESFHPNPYGHQLMADAILAQYPDLRTVTMPSPNHSVQIPEPDASFYGPFGAPIVYQVTTKTVSLSSVNTKTVNLLALNVPETFQLDGLKPSSSAHAIINSTPTDLGTYVVNQSGAVDIPVTIPNTVAPGIHMLHFYGTSPSGAAIDYYKQVYVRGPEGDVDGDGISDSQDACSFVDPVNTDSDNDGVDDACDGYIGLKPAQLQAPDLIAESDSGISDTDNVTNISTIGVGGGCTAKTVLVSVDAANAGTADCVGGSYRYNFQNLLAEGSHRISAVQQEEDGSKSDVSTELIITIDTTKPDLVDIATPIEAEELEELNTITGSCEQGAEITIIVDVTSEELKASCVDGMFEAAIVSPPSEGGFVLTANQVDIAGNVSDSTERSATIVVKPTSPLYRARNGDLLRLENPNKVYIERDVAEAQKWLNIHDYDPDNDGWSLVGWSKDSTQVGKISNLIIDNGLVPHVSIRTPKNGCVRLTPQNLGEVVARASRYLEIEAQNTNSCRNGAPSDDLDLNGTPDNQQALYRARNIFSAKNNILTKTVVLERSVYAAEAIMGISDYDKDLDGWVLVAQSKDAASRGIFKVLVSELGDDLLPNQLSPMVIVENKKYGCIALTPKTLSVVKRGDKRERTFLKTTLPAGQACK